MNSCALLMTFVIHITLTSADNAICIQRDVCSCKMSGGKDDGKIVSLWQIDHPNGDSYTAFDKTSSSTLLYNPCTPLNVNTGECKGALACRKDSQNNYFNLGTPDKIKMASDPLAFAYTGSKVPGRGTRIIVVLLECDHKVETAKLDGFTSTKPYTYSVTLTSKCACPGVCRPKALVGTTPGLSTGSILCIVLLVAVIVYLVGGVLINRYGRKKEGSEMIPNRDFWKDIPILVKDGAVFTYRKIRKKDNEYEEI